MPLLIHLSDLHLDLEESMGRTPFLLAEHAFAQACPTSLEALPAAALTSIKGLNALAEIPQRLTILNNPALAGVDGFNSLVSIGGNLNVGGRVSRPRL